MTFHPIVSILGLLLTPVILQAIPDWMPTVRDRPVNAEQLESIRLALPSEPIATPEKTHRVLVYSATAGFRHRSIPVGKTALTHLGEATGAYEAVVSDDLANFEPAALKTFAAVILLNVTGNFFMPGSETLKSVDDPAKRQALLTRHNRLVDNLLEYVEQGGGLVGIHSATDACYSHEGYGETMGAYFDGHPWTAAQQVTIVIEDSEHALIRPVFAEMADFEIVDEIYQFKDEPYSRERLRILLSLDPERSQKPKGKMKRADNDYAVSWIQEVGEGRVFYTSLGHNEHVYWNPLMLKHYLAGIQYATGDIDADATPSAAVARNNSLININPNGD